MDITNFLISWIMEKIMYTALWEYVETYNVSNFLFQINYKMNDIT